MRGKPSPIEIDKMLKALGIDARLVGKEYVAHCPNAAGHSRGDKNPSWRMRNAPNSDKHCSHKCWPCGFGGGPVELVMKVRDLVERASAYEWISQFKSGEGEEVSSIRWENVINDTGFNLPSGVKFKPLEEWPRIPREYAISRGITPEQVEKWGIGYAIDGKLRGRIIIVARDALGRPMNYTARAWNKKSSKRYLAAARDEHPDLGAMFGEQYWPDVADRLVAVVVEGGINGLTVDRALIKIPFATIGGSNPHPAHHAKLRTFPVVVLLTDPDIAGNKASADLADALCRHVHLVRAHLPEGMDAQDAGEEIVRESVCRSVEDVSRTSPSFGERVQTLFASISTQGSSHRVAS